MWLFCYFQNVICDVVVHEFEWVITIVIVVKYWRVWRITLRLLQFFSMFCLRLLLGYLILLLDYLIIDLYLLLLRLPSNRSLLNTQLGRELLWLKGVWAHMLYIVICTRNFTRGDYCLHRVQILIRIIIIILIYLIFYGFKVLHHHFWIVKRIHPPQTTSSITQLLIYLLILLLGMGFESV